MLSTITFSKIGTLLLLYLVQGIPYGFQSRFLPIYLRTQGMSLTSLGFFKILLIPWALKVFWAPLVDNYATKRFWLLTSLGCLAASCAMATVITPDQTSFLCVIVFCLNLFASTQDIAVDGIAIQILTPEELGAGNTVQVVGYKIGAIFGGGVSVWLIVHTGWSGLFVLLASFYIVTLLAAAQMKQLGAAPSYITKPTCKLKVDMDTDDDLHLTKSDGILRDRHKFERKDSDERNDIERTQEMMCPSCKTIGVTMCGCKQSGMPSRWSTFVPEWVHNTLSIPYSTWTVCYVVFYKLGEQGAVGMFPLFLVDHGIPATDVTLWTGVIGQGLSITGSLFGGWLLTSKGLSPLQILPVLFGLRLVPITMETILIGLSGYSNPTYGMCIGTMCLLQLIGGAITTATFTLMMQCSQGAPDHMQATHYTALATLEVMGKLSFMSVIGLVTDMVGYFVVFCCFIGLSILVFPLLKMRKERWVLL